MCRGVAVAASACACTLPDWPSYPVVFGEIFGRHQLCVTRASRPSSRVTESCHQARILPCKRQEPRRRVTNLARQYGKKSLGPTVGQKKKPPSANEKIACTKYTSYIQIHGMSSVGCCQPTQCNQMARWMCRDRASITAGQRRATVKANEFSMDRWTDFTGVFYKNSSCS